MNRRPPIKGGFRVLIVPRGDVEQNGLTVPLSFQSASMIRAVGYADRFDVSASPWAFTKASRASVVKMLRNLADWIENNPVDE